MIENAAKHHLEAKADAAATDSSSHELEWTVMRLADILCI